MGREKRRRHRKKGLGLSMAEFAKEIDTPLTVVEEMVESGQVAVVALGSKMKRIPRSEVTKFKELLGEAAE